MGRTANVAGTGYKNPDGSNRRNIIRRFVRENMPVTLRREPHDINAVEQIGYLKASAAISITKILDTGERLTGRIGSYYAPPGEDHPRVSLAL